MIQYPILTMLIVVLSCALLLSCDKEKETLSNPVNNGNAPFNPITNPTPPANSGTPNLSPVNDTDQVYYFLSPSTYPVVCDNFYCTPRSRYIFRRDGSFVLQFDQYGGNEYLSGIQYGGRYTKTLDSLSFKWEGWSTAGPWEASGTLKGDILTVKYNMVMTMCDFEDAKYLRKP